MWGLVMLADANNTFEGTMIYTLLSIARINIVWVHQRPPISWLKRAVKISLRMPKLYLRQ